MPRNRLEIWFWLLCVIPPCVVCYRSCGYDEPPKRPAIELPPVIVTATPAVEKRS